MGAPNDPLELTLLRIVRMIKDLTNSKFYGSVTLRFEGGVPKFAEKVEKIKLG
jgi:hypothetical protein